MFFDLVELAQMSHWITGLRTLDHSRINLKLGNAAPIR
jgi:hypothetical protein